MDNIDISLIYEELHYNGRSILPTPRPSPSLTTTTLSPSSTPTPTTPIPTPFHPFSTHQVCTRPALVRWSYSEPISLLNVVVMELKDVERHERECGLGIPEEQRKTGAELWGEEVEMGVQGVREEALRVVQWRERQGKVRD